MEFHVPPEEEIPETEAGRIFDKRMWALIERLKFPDQLPDEGSYKKPYLILFNGITSALQAMEELNFGRARQMLVLAQQDAEEAYLASCEENDDTVSGQ